MDNEIKEVLVELNSNMKAARFQNGLLLLVCGMTFGIALSILFI